MESKIGGGFTRNTCGIKGVDSCSSTGVDGPFSGNRSCDDRLHASSEASNLPSASSSWDSYSENAENKATLTATVTHGALEDTDMPTKVSSGEAVGDQLLPGQTDVTPRSPFPSYRQNTSDLPYMTSSSRVEEQQALEFHGDGISHVTGVRDAHITVHDHTLDLDKKDSTCSTSRSSLLAEGIEEAVQDKTAHGYHDHEIENSQKNSRSPSACPVGLLQKENNGSSSTVSGLSHNSDLVEFPSSKQNPSSQVQSPCSKSQEGYYFCKNADSKDQEGNESCLLKKEPSECSKEDAESSFVGQFAAGSVDGNKSAPLPNNEYSKASHTRGGSSVGSLKNNGPLETGIGMDHGIPSDETMKCGIVNEQFEKSSSLVEASNVQRSQMHTQPTSETESENSAATEDDVKVCDICGDAGQEELLAICSRCSDGAEHTYCMRIMLDKLPEGDWLCEECKLEEETKNNEGDKSESVSGASKVPCSDEHSENIGGTFNPKLLPNLVTNPMDEAARGASKEQVTPQISDKRHDGNIEVTSMATKEASETSCGSRGTRKETVFSHRSSFNNLDMGRGKPSKLASSCGSHSANNSQPIAHSQTSSVSNSSYIQPGLRSSRGPLSKSVSFNNSNVKPKVKQLTGTVPQMQMLARENASSNTRKEELVRKMTKSTSFKDTSLGYSNIGSISKLQPVPRRADDTRGAKQVREKNIIEKKNSSVIDPPLPKSDLKVAHTSEPNILGINRGSDDANNNLGCNELKQQSIYISKSSRGPSSNGICNFEDEKPCQVVSNNDLHADSTVADRSCGNPDTVAQHSASQAVESARWDDKIKDPTFFSSSKQAVSGGSRILRCQKCNETGHSTQNCSIDKLRLTALKPSADRNLKEHTDKSSKWKYAVEAAISKATIQKSDRFANPTEKFLMSSTHMNCEVAPKNFLSSSLSCVSNLPSLEGTTVRQEILRSFVADPNKTGVVRKPQSIHQTGALCVPRASELNSAPIISDELNVKPFIQIFADQSSVLANPLRASVIPELEFIWQGGIEVLRTGRHPELCEGVQAHLSTCASPKVLEVATKFPCRVQVDEVPRLSSWPLQFQGNTPKEDNIALFFFAKDIESYEKNYRNLLENMLHNDLALRGNIDGVELLIFPSNKLPENSQRWNRLFFLWGVFRGRRPNCLEVLPGSLDRPVGSTLNVELLSAPLISEASTSAKSNSTVNQEKELSMCDRSAKEKAVNSITCVNFPSISSSEIEDRICHTQESHLVQKSEAAVDNNLPSEHTSCSFLVSCSLKSMSQFRSLPATQLCSEVNSDVTCLKNFISDSEGGKDAVTHVSASTPNCKQSAESEGKQKLMEGEVVLDNNLQEDVIEIDRMSWESRNDRKRARSTSTNTTSHASDETLKSTGETMQWTKKANCTFVNGDKENNKMKLDSGGHTSCSYREESLSSKVSSKVHPWSASYLNNSVYDGTMMPEIARSAERHFFPVDFGLVKDAKPDNFIYVLSSDDEDSPESNALNLELALGGEMKSPKQEILPLFSPKNGKRSDQDGPSMVDRDEGSASLSLSLAFHASE